VEWKNTNLVKQDISNYMTKMLREWENDITQVVHFFKKQPTADPSFFFSFDADDNSKVKNLFWAYGASRSWYARFGDVFSFGTMFNTNKYNLKFAPFVGINGHGDNLLFAGDVLSDETITAFRWLFATFVSCMGGPYPKSIIIDQCHSIEGAILLELPDTTHSLH
jgi:hypothetical protein